jgi:2-methylisocitrate lyase-like PEP mutase family enzyme
MTRLFPQPPGPAASPARRLSALLAQPGLKLMPCCFDALSARLIEDAGFPLTFMSGFGVAAARLALPDTGLASYAEVLDQGRSILAAVRIPVIADGDTGYGNAVNVKRTVHGFARAGFAAVMIEDQVAPKRCGHTAGKAVVGFDAAVARLRAAVDARDEGAEILILARTDARAVLGLDEALRRARAFRDLGADILFVESPESEAEMRRICAEVPAPHLANMLEGGRTPVLPPERLAAAGYALAAYPLTLLSAAIRAMQDALADLARGTDPGARLLDFASLRRLLGFDAYDEEAARYRPPE